MEVLERETPQYVDGKTDQVALKFRLKAEWPEEAQAQAAVQSFADYIKAHEARSSVLRPSGDTYRDIFRRLADKYSSESEFAAAKAAGQRRAGSRAVGQ